MANKQNIDIDGQTIVPDWSTESTLEKVLDVLETLSGVTKKSKEELADALKDQAKDEAKSDKKLESAILGLKDDKDGKKLIGAPTKSLGMFSSALSIGAATLGLFGTALATTYHAIKGLGDDLRTQTGGTGLDVGGQMGDAAFFRASIQALGYTAEDVSQRFENAADVIAVAGRESFWNLTKEIQDISGAGSNFGLTLTEMSSALDDDLKLRKQIGILNMLDGNKQAKRSADLFAHQLKATAILGKSIAEIAGSADDTLTSNASVSLLIQSMGKGSQEFTTQVQKMAGDMTATGLGQGVNNAIQNAMLESVAFRTDAGGDLYEALTTLDANAGTDLRARIQQINAMVKTDPIRAGEMMQEFSGVLVGGAKNLTDDQMQRMRPIIEGFGDLGKQMMLSIGQLRQSSEVDARFNELAQSSATVDNAFQKFKSGISSSINMLAGAFGTPLSKVMNAFTESHYTLKGVIKTQEEYDKLTKAQQEEAVETESIFTMFNEALRRISDQFSKMFSITADAGGKMKNFSKLLKDKLQPIIQGFGDKVVAWLASWTAEDVEGTINNIILWFGIIAESAMAVGKALAWFAGFVVDTDPGKDKDGNLTGEEVFDLSGTIRNALLIAVGASVVKNAFAGLFKGTIGAAVSKIGSKIPGFGGQGKLAESTGKSFGKGAAGLLAFGAAMAGIGVAAAGLTYSMKTLGEMKFGDLAIGFIAIGAALALAAVGMLAGGAAAAAASPGLGVMALAMLAVGAAAAGIGAAAAGFSLLKDSAADKIAIQDATVDNLIKMGDISEEDLNSTAAGIETIAEAMVAFGDATNDGWFSGPDLDDQDRQLGIFEKFSQLDGTRLMAFTDGMTALIETIEKLNAINTAEIVASADALAQLNEATRQSFGDRLMTTVDNVAGMLFGNDGTPQIAANHASPATDTSANTATPLTAFQSKNTELLEQIRDNTKKTVKKINDLPETISA